MKDLQVSKFLSLVLRHKPEEAGIQLDEEGWVRVDSLLSGLLSRGMKLERADLERIAAADEKGRYTLRGEWMRANQGHSLAGVCAVELVPVDPPQFLYHGTTRERWEQIQESPGLKPGQRHHVHLSEDVETARKVGSRHRREHLQILRVSAQAYHAQGGIFYRSDNGVWMADQIPLAYLEVMLE